MSSSNASRAPTRDHSLAGPEAAPSARERPILFSAPMVRALLAGTKTQTRRIVKSQPPFDAAGCHDANMGGKTAWFDFWTANNPRTHRVPCPYGVPGDVLWVRESWCHAGTSSGFAYMADAPVGSDQRGMGWRPSIHMPRAASRISLQVTEVRVERLNEIDDSAAFAEGVSLAEGGGFEVPGTLCFSGTPRSTYASLWRQINGPGSWDANPWVWAVSFEVIKSLATASPSERPAMPRDEQP